MKSPAHDRPLYPDDSALFSSDYAGDTRYEDGDLSPGVWHYRLCILTRFGDRWVSPVATLSIEPAQARRSPPTAADFEGPSALP